MPSPEIKAWLDLFQGVLTSLAILGAGLWALWRYRVLQEPEKVEAEIRNLRLGFHQKALEMEELTLKLKRRAVVQVNIEARAEQLTDGRRCVLAQVQLSNTGNRATRLDWKNRLPFSIVPVDFKGDGTPDYKTAGRIDLPVPMTLNPNVPARAHVIRDGASESIPFALCVTTPGLYLVSFRAEVDEGDRSESYEAGTPEGLPLSWVGRAFVEVP